LLSFFHIVIIQCNALALNLRTSFPQNRSQLLKI